MNDKSRCDEFGEMISRRMDGDLSTEEIQQLEEHLATCLSCKRLAIDLRATVLPLQALALQPVPASYLHQQLESLEREGYVDLTSVFADKQEAKRDRTPALRVKQIWIPAFASIAALIAIIIAAHVPATGGIGQDSPMNSQSNLDEKEPERGSASVFSSWSLAVRDVLRGEHRNSGQSVKRPQLEIALRVLHVSMGSGNREMISGQALRSGEHFRIQVDLNQPAYVYVLLRSSDGALAQLSQRSDSQGLWNPSRGSLQIPETQEPPLQLDEHIGQEQLLIVAALNPIEEADHALCIALPCLCRSRTACGELLETLMLTIQRGSEPPGSHEPSVLRRHSDENGVALLHFLIKHIP